MKLKRRARLAAQLFSAAAVALILTVTSCGGRTGSAIAPNPEALSVKSLTASPTPTPKPRASPTGIALITPKPKSSPTAIPTTAPKRTPAPTPTPTPAPTASPALQFASMNLGPSGVTDPTYGFIRGYFNGSTSGSTPQILHLVAAGSVKFVNTDVLTHTASFLGNATASSAPWPASFNGSSSTSPAGTAIGTTGFSTGSVSGGTSSLIYKTGAPGFYMIGCAFHYDLDKMRTVAVVK